MKNLINTFVKKLIEKKIKISLAESCTGGLISSSITSVSGSSKIFELGLITYSNDAKINVLKVPKGIIDKFGAVSKECCTSMVENIYKLSKSNIAISITGIAGPTGASKDKPVGLVFIGIRKKNKTSVHKFTFKNKGRLFIQKSTIKKTLSLVLELIK